MCPLSITALYPQMWLRLKKVWARGCWTWRSRRSWERMSWRAWRNSWGSTRQRVSSLIQNYSILCMLAVKEVQSLFVYVASESSLAWFTLSPVGILNRSFQISAERAGESERHWTRTSDSTERGGWGHNRGHPFSSVSVIEKGLISLWLLPPVTIYEPNITKMTPFTSLVV